SARGASEPAMGAERAAGPAGELRVPLTLEPGTRGAHGSILALPAGASIGGMSPRADDGVLIITFPRRWTAAQRLSFMADVARALPREHWAHVGGRMCTDSSDATRSACAAV